jgi:hypothetical protein
VSDDLAFWLGFAGWVVIFVVWSVLPTAPK